MSENIIDDGDDNQEDEQDVAAGNGKAAPHINWVPNPDLERWLDTEYAGKVNWILKKDLPFSKIDIAASLDSQVRLGDKLVDSQLEAIRLRLGTLGALTWPPLVGWRPDSGRHKGKLVLLDGLHRTTVLIELKIYDPVWLYELRDVGEGLAEAIGRGINTLNGLPPNADDKLEACVQIYLASNKTTSVREIARAHAVNHSTLRNRCLAVDIEERFAKGGDLHVPGYQRIPRKSFYHLTGVDSVVRLRAAAVALLTLMSIQDSHVDKMGKLLRRMKNRSDKAVLVEINRLAEELRETCGQVRRVVSPQVQLLSEVRRCRTALADSFKDMDPKDVLTDLAQRGDFAREALELRDQLSAILGGL